MNNPQHSSLSYIRLYTRLPVLLLLLFLTLFCLIGFTEIELSIDVSGIVSPLAERIEIRSPSSGTIGQIFAVNGQQLKKNAPILRLTDRSLQSEVIRIEQNIRTTRETMNDLACLLSQPDLRTMVISGLKRHSFRQQLEHIQAKLRDQELHIASLRKERDSYRVLSEGNTVAPNEVFRKEKEWESSVASWQIVVAGYREQWSQEYDRVKSEMTKYRTDSMEISSRLQQLTITTTGSGHLLFETPLTVGSVVFQGDKICMISPDTSLLVECSVPASGIGNFRTGQKVAIRIESQPESLLTPLTGKIKEIENDFRLSDQTPVFRIRCEIDTPGLAFHHIHLRKGMTVRCSFITEKKRLLLILFQRFSGWLTPSASFSNINI